MTIAPPPRLIRRRLRSSMITVVGCAALLVLAAGCCESSPTPNPSPSDPKFIAYDARETEVIGGEYLVVFRPDRGVDPHVLAPQLTQEGGGGVDYVFTKAFVGFAADHLDDAWAVRVSRRDDVLFVRQNFRINGLERRGGPLDPVPWNLDRIDQRASFAMDRDLRYKTGPATGPQVPIYVLDNGVNRDHQEFAAATGSRVTNVADLTGKNFARCSLPGVRDAGHGTAVASIAAGARLGILRTTIMNIKVLDRDALGISCTGGDASMVDMGLEEVLKHLQSTNAKRAVVNLSVGWSGQTPDGPMAIARLQDAGAVVVAAAGNENVDAASTAPANLPGVVAVGGITDQNKRYFSATDGSNFGSTVALWAPGHNVRGADWPATPDPTATRDDLTGTSFAAPHVTGAVALLWQQEPGLTASQVVQALKDRATHNMLTDLGSGSDNALLFVGEDAPKQTATWSLPPAASDSAVIEAARVSVDGRRLFVAGSGAIAYAAFDPADLNAGPKWTERQAAPLDLDCADISASELLAPGAQPGAGRMVYFGCTGNLAPGRAAVVVATQADNVNQWMGWLPAGSDMAGVTDGFVENRGSRVYALTTEPAGSCVQAWLTEIDPDDGKVLGRVKLAAPDFTEACNAGVDVVLLEVPDGPGSATTKSELVVATFADPPGADKTFLWRVNPNTLTVQSWGEVPPPAQADAGQGMIATALAVDPYETNGGSIQRPGHVFLTTQVQRSGPPGDPTSGPWAYLYRVGDSLVSAGPIESVPRAMVNSLWCDQGDVFYGGLESASGNFGSDSELFIRKNEGVSFNPRRWRLGFAPRDPMGMRGVAAVGQGRAYIVSRASNSIGVTQYAVY